MGKKQRRSRRKEPSGEEVFFALIAGAAALLYVNGVSFHNIVWYAFYVVAILLVAGFIIWFARGMIKTAKSAEPLEFRKDQPKFKRTKPVQQETRSPVAASSKNSPAPSEWSEELIAQLEWRVFEKLCTRLWQEKGFSVKETGAGADGGVDFYLHATATKQKIGAVQCKSWSKRQIDVKVVRELQGVVASEQLKLGLLMYSGTLSTAAKEFIANPAVSIKVQGNKHILKEIQKLETVKQTQMLNELFTEDHQVPSCPNCDVKMVERTAKKTGNTFWGCESFPRCRFTMR
jgi:restriction system protein